MGDEGLNTDIAFEEKPTPYAERITIRVEVELNITTKMTCSLNRECKGYNNSSE